MFAEVLRELRPDVLVLRSFEVDENRSAFGGTLFETAGARDSFATRYREAVRLSAPYPEIWGENSYLTAYTRVGGF